MVGKRPAWPAMGRIAFPAGERIRNRPARQMIKIEEVEIVRRVQPLMARGVFALKLERIRAGDFRDREFIAFITVEHPAHTRQEIHRLMVRLAVDMILHIKAAHDLLNRTA